MNRVLLIGLLSMQAMASDKLPVVDINQKHDVAKTKVSANVVLHVDSATIVKKAAITTTKTITVDNATNKNHTAPIKEDLSLTEKDMMLLRSQHSPPEDEYSKLSVKCDKITTKKDCVM